MSVNKHYYVVIVGLGPAALGVTEVLKDDNTLAPGTLILEKGNLLDQRTCAVRDGKKCKACNPCNIRSGVGGAGPFTDGKICLYPQNLGELFQHSQEEGGNGAISDRIQKYLKRVQEIWSSHGAEDYKEIKANGKMENLKAEALKHGLTYVTYPVLHIGSDGANAVIKHYQDDIIRAGITIETKSDVTGIVRKDNMFEIEYRKTKGADSTETRKVDADFLVLALGREMQKPVHVNQLLKNLGLSFDPKNLDIGCRVEVPYQIMSEVTDITYDPKFTMITSKYNDSVRTFCTCHRGRIVREGDCVNGDVDKTALTQNTNFAILVSWPLNDYSLDGAMDFGNDIASLVLAQGKGNPIIQRLGDLKRGAPSTLENIKKGFSYVKPTLRLDRYVTPGDIARCYPGKIVDDILEGLAMLDKVIKGVDNDQNLLYAPELKPSCSIRLKDGLKTEVPNLYVCGDFSGYTRGIAQAMCMGIMVGEDIINEVRKKGFQLKL